MPECVYNKVYVLKCEVWEVRDMIVLRYTIAVVACNGVVQLGVVDSSDLVIIQVPSCQAHVVRVYTMLLKKPAILGHTINWKLIC